MPNADDSTRVVVVGGGLAGVRTCEELRRQGYSGDITLVAAEPGPPYDRPPLSKGRDGVERADLRIDLQALDVRVLAVTRAAALRGVETGTATVAEHPSASDLSASDLSASEVAPNLPAADESEHGRALGVVLDDDLGTELPAHAVVIATGASPIVPSAWPTTPGVRVLRTREDAEQLWAALDAVGPTARVAVLGGSWIGLEFATVACELGVSVTIYERAAWLLPMLPPEAGRVVKHWCEAAGVEVHLGAAVEELVVAAPETASAGAAAPEVEAPHLAAAHPAAAHPITVRTATSAEQFDLVLVALGVAPETAWLDSTGLPRSTKGALKVDAHLRTRDPRVVGVGDAVERWSPRYQRALPAGHWQDARDEPVVAAASVIAALAGETGTAQLGAPYDTVPYFWSETFGHTIQFSGFVPDYHVARMVVRGSLTADSWTLCWLDPRDRLQAVLACDRPRDAITARKALAADPEGLPTVDPTVLADADTPLAASLQPPVAPQVPGKR